MGKEDIENRLKGDIIKKALLIVDELGNAETNDELLDLKERALKLKKDRLWRMK